MKVLFLGDIVGRPGRQATSMGLDLLRKEHDFSLIVANVENAAGGNGFTGKILRQFNALGISGLTGGNHSWDNPEGVAILDEYPGLLRPANYPADNPGRGFTELAVEGGLKILLINLQGRVFMPATECPFKTADRIIEEWGARGPILIDFHAEASSEKCALARYLDGRVAAVLGTHTHVQTADARLLAGGTAFITDLGMTGPHDGVIGVDEEAVIGRFLTQRPARFSVAKSGLRMQGAIVKVDAETNMASGIERIDIDLESA